MLRLAFKNIFFSPLSSFLSIALFSFGTCVILTILLINNHLEEEVDKNFKNIDMVVGAKGSPLQIILCNVLHIDFPTGNIALKDAYEIANNRLIDQAIPLALGDSYQGYRIIGATVDFAQLYSADLANGEWFQEEMTAVIGAKIASQLNLDIGDSLTSNHGLVSNESNHQDHPIKIVGKLHPTGTVIDRLILVSIESVWEMHGDHPERHDEEIINDEKISLKKLGLTVTKEAFAKNEITSLLISYKTPLAAVRLPMLVNSKSNLQAASPSFEMVRLFSLLDWGIAIANALGIIIVVVSALSIFIALLNSLKERKYELAVLRSIGASQAQVFTLIMVEGFIITFIGTLSGFMMAHICVGMITASFETFNIQQHFIEKEVYIIGASFLIGIFASFIPALMVYKTPISKVLSKS